MVFVYAVATVVLVAIAVPVLLIQRAGQSAARLSRNLHERADRRHGYRRTPVEPDPFTGSESDD
jgi:hypothetical protein